MNHPIPKQTLRPPAGRPSWRGEAGLPLIYLGWGRRDFSRHPLPLHCDLGTNYYLVVRGAVQVTAAGQPLTVRGPLLLLFDPECPFGITQSRRAAVEILVWIWQGRPQLENLRPPAGGFRQIPLTAQALPPLQRLHERCRDEVARADDLTPAALSALHRLVDVAMARAAQPKKSDPGDVRWELATAWIGTNLSIHAPVPALCDYLRMSPKTLQRFFQRQAGVSPGVYFRRKKLAEAERLISQCGWQVKAAAFHLGYRHPNDLSRTLARPAKNPGTVWTGGSRGLCP